MAIKSAQPVTVSLQDLQSNSVPFSTLLSAFGPDSLGILVVTDLPPAFPTLRHKVLSNSSRLAALPSPTLQSLTNPTAKYLVGWSHGVETLKPGIVDTAKGSYYLNCAFYRSPELQGADSTKNPGFEEYTAPNIWPSEADIPGFRADAEALISLIIDTAVLVAKACDTFAQREVDGYEPGYLQRVVKQSTTSKARLLHYFPNGSQQPPLPSASPTSTQEDSDDLSSENDDWCATHLDHGCLTGLTSAMFLDDTDPNDLTELSTSPDPKAGLYIRSRANETFKVAIPRHALAFQTGEALELITQGRFKAVPHFVRGVANSDSAANDDDDVAAKTMRVARNTLAVFTQPDLDEVVDARTGLTFGEFARGVVKKNTAR
jgi:isopenicillin N synthase-like dioxygenase